MSVQIALLPVQLETDFVAQSDNSTESFAAEWEKYRVKDVPSDLFYFPDLISDDEERKTVEGICSEPESEWIRGKGQNKQEWGTLKDKDGFVEMSGKQLPEWSDAVVDQIISLGIDFPETQNGRPMFLRVNEYEVGHGIRPHADVAVPGCFNAIVTMNGTALLDFYEPEKEGIELTLEERHICSVLMEPRSLLVVSGEMFNKLHGIKEAEFDLITENVVNRGEIPLGTEIPRQTRYSLAFSRGAHGKHQ